MGDYGVYFVFENYGGLIVMVDGLMSIVNDVDSLWFGVNFDMGNFYSEDIYSELE